MPSQQVIFIGTMHVVDYGIWGPTDPRPTPPIYWPGFPGQPPVGEQPPLGIWGPPTMPPGFWGGGMGPGVKPQPPGEQPPLGIWGPPNMPPGFWGGGLGPGVKPQPHPEHPIYYPPQPPLGFWGPNDPRPSNPIYWPGFPNQPPIVLPPKPEEPPSEGTKPPPEDGGWGYHPEYGWGYFPAGKAPGPKS